MDETLNLGPMYCNSTPGNEAVSVSMHYPANNNLLCKGVAEMVNSHGDSKPQKNPKRKKLSLYCKIIKMFFNGRLKASDLI